MKKIFFFAVAAMAALSMNAQQIVFSDADVAAAGELDGKAFGTGNLILTVTDQATKVAIDANNCHFGDANAQVKFTHRLKTGGKSTSKNTLNLTIGKAGKLYIYVRTGSNSATDRNLVVSQFGADLINKVILESDAINVAGLDSDDPAKETKVYPVLTCDVGVGNVEINYPVNGLNFYAFSLDGPVVPSEQGFENANAAVKAEKFFRNGQLIIRKNGVEYNAIGTQF